MNVDPQQEITKSEVMVVVVEQHGTMRHNTRRLNTMRLDSFSTNPGAQLADELTPAQCLYADGCNAQGLPKLHQREHIENYSSIKRIGRQAAGSIG